MGLPYSTVRAAALTAVLLGASEARAALIMEPVFNRVAGSGIGPDSLAIYRPDVLVNGVAYFTADEPGEIITYASGDPRDPILDTIHIVNNTQYIITGFTLSIVGTGTNTRDPGSVVRGPVDATWGDVDSDGQVGISDIFSSITVSPDGKVIHFSGGLIPPGGRFTDIHLAVSDSPPFLAGVDSSFEGELVPEPHTFVLGACSLVALLVRKRLLMSRNRP